MTLLSDDEWADQVATRAGTDDVAAVKTVLEECGVTAGRPPTGQHSMKVEGVYFAGVKAHRPSPYSPDAPRADGDDSGLNLEPFAFRHSFKEAASPVTVFATNHKNEAGKSTILRVILWAVRGISNLQDDLEKGWLREAAVILQVDNERLLVHWRIDGGRPDGAIVALRPTGDLDWTSLAKGGRVRAAEEVHAPGANNEWPAYSASNQLVADGRATILASFETAAEFKSASEDQMLGRLGLEAIRTWAARAGGVDENDGGLKTHGWKSLSQAIAILNPSVASVLGEEPRTAGLILSLFLGSTWGPTATNASWQMKRAQQHLAGLRRRLEVDREARNTDLQALENELAQLESQLTAFGDVPDAETVMAANDTANRDSITASRAQSETWRLAGNLGEAQRALAAAAEDLHALQEADATRRFWHSLRPSCCPRCDAKIDVEMMRREVEGQCSLCSSDLGPQDEPTPHVVSVPVAVDIDDHDEESTTDELAVLHEQLEELRLRVSEADEAHDLARAEESRLMAVAEESARLRDNYDKDAASQRHALELKVVGLRARVDERTRVNEVASEGASTGRGTIVPLAPQEAAVEVLVAAETLAKEYRNAEQRELLAQVSTVITRLGKEFGVRNLQDAKLDGAAHLPVWKGAQKTNFGGLTPGERLRLRVALIVGLLEVGEVSRTGRHPRLLIIDDITDHEVAPGDAIKMAQALAKVPDLQVICASTYGPELGAALAPGSVVMPPVGQEVQF